MRNISLYAIYGAGCRTLYVGSTDFLRARLARHAWDLANGQHHSPGLEQAYSAAKKSRRPLRVLGLDWDTDESLIRLLEDWLISELPTLLPEWKLANDKLPSQQDLKRFGSAYLRKAEDRASELALPSLTKMQPVLATQVTGELDDFLRFTDDMRRAKAAQARRAAGR